MAPATLYHPDMTKPELRARMRALRKALAAQTPDAAARAAAHAPALLAAAFPEGAAGRVAALYAAVGSELDAGPLGEALAAAGLRLALPRADARSGPLTFLSWSPGDPLEPDAAGCPAPLDLAEPVRPDLVVTPLLAFDGAGGRLGQGGGHYDRTLAALRAEGPVRAVGLAYAGQGLGALPAEAHDQPLDGVLTELGYMPARKDPA